MTAIETEPKNLYDFFIKKAKAHAGKVAFKQVADNKLITTIYKNLTDQIEEYQKKLEHYKLLPGTRVGLLAPSSSDWVVSYLACLACKLTVVCLDPGLNQEQLSDLAKRTNIHLLLLDGALPHKFSAEFFAVLDIKEKLNCLSEARNKIEIIESNIDPNIASILFTSGTSGEFKGVLLEHSALVYATQLGIELTHATSNDNVLCLLPSHHVYTLVCVILSAMLVGGSITFVEKLEGPYILQAMQQGKPKVLIGVPRIYELLTTKIVSEIEKKSNIVKVLAKGIIYCCIYVRKWTNLNPGRVIFSKIHTLFGGKMQYLISGAAPLPNDIFNILYGLGFTLLEGYGLTETCGSVVVNSLKKQKVGSVGQAMAGIEIKLHEPDEHGVGEICVRSPTLMRGYFEDKENTNKALRNKWLHTGDLGIFDKEGFLYIKGRINELIILSSGKKVSPTFIESFLTGLPHTEAVAAVGIADRHMHGEHIHVAIVIKSESISLLGRENCEEIIKNEINLRLNEMPEWCHFSQLHFIKNIPKTNTLKVKREALARLLQSANFYTNSESIELYESEKNNNDLEREIINLIADINPDVNSKLLNSKSSLQFDVGFDSIHMRELAYEIEKKYAVILEADKLASIFRVQDLTKLISLSEPSEISKSHEQTIFMRDEMLAEVNKNFIQLVDYHGAKKVVFYLSSSFMKKIFLKYFDYSIYGLENIDPNTAYIVCANHTSHLDNLSLSIALDRCSIRCVAAAAKDYFFDKKVISWIMRRIFKIIPFDREKSYRDVQKNIAYVQLCTQHGYSILIFPEGTRSLTGEIASFKKGVALFSDVLNINILPAYIEGTYNCLPKGKLFPKRGKITVCFGRPINIHNYFSTKNSQYTKDKFKATDYHEFMCFLKDQILNLKQ